MTPDVFRPSTKTTRVAYVAALAVIALAIGLYFYIDERPLWAPAAAALLLIWPIRMHLRRLAVKLMVDEDHLTLERGLLSKTTRTLAMARVQDVTVQQSVFQRILGVGDIRVETAGEGSALTAESFDRPKQLAQRILEAAHGGRKAAGL